MNPHNFFAELKRRNVIRMAGLYLVGAWLLTQVAGTVLPMFGAPDWLPRSIVILLAIGLLPALIFSWVFELTPQGLKRDEDVKPEESIAPQTARRMNRMIFAVLVLALAYFGFDKFVLAPKRDAALIAITTQNLAKQATPQIQKNDNTKSIAVLPFENLSGNADNAYFVSGMQDLILTNLAKISALKVISRTSTEKYTSHPDNLTKVGAELGVATLLEGSVQRAGDQVLINLQLIDARTDTHLWAETYSRKIEDIFSVEQEVAKTVAAALQARLLPTEAVAVASKPTENPAAYDLFLRAEFLNRKGYQNDDAETLSQAIDLYQKAIAEDPNFALALTQLAFVRAHLYWLGGAPNLSAKQLAPLADAAVQEALRLRSDLPEAKVALGFVRYRVHHDFAGALAAFDAVLAVRPSDPRALYGRALVIRRQGRWADGVKGLEAALSINPQDSNLAAELADCQWRVRNTAQAEAGFRRALALDPGNTYAMGRLASLQLYRHGDAAGALAALQGDATVLVLARISVLRLQRKYDEAQKLLATIPDNATDLAVGNTKALLSGKLYLAAGQQVAAEPLLRQARAELEVRARSLPPGYFRAYAIHLSLAEIDALLGDESAALKSTAAALELLPIDKDAMEGQDNLAGAARVYAELGRADLVVPALKQLCSRPGDTNISASLLRLDPVWDKVRADPGFQAEIQRYAELDQP